MPAEVRRAIGWVAVGVAVALCWHYLTKASTAYLLDLDVYREAAAVAWDGGDLYGQVIEVEFHAFIRGEAKFADLHAVTGNLAMPGFTAPKLMWVAEHEPELFARVARVLAAPWGHDGTTERSCVSFSTRSTIARARASASASASALVMESRARAEMR